MQINQCYATINAVNKQIWGENAVAVNDLSGLISLGQQFSGDLAGADKFLGKLVDRIGKTVIRRLDLELDYPGLYMDSFSFGAILQKISTNPIDAVRSSEYDVGSNDFSPTFANVVKNNNVHVSYFTDMDTFSFVTTIPHNLFFTAFTSESAMSNFIDSLISSMSDSVTLSVNDWARTAVNNFMAEKIISGNGVINLLTEYNTAYGLTGNDALTAEKAMHDKEFARFASQEIRKYVKYLSQPSTLYNMGGADGSPIVRTTTRDNMHIFFLTNLVCLFDSTILSESFRDLYDLPYYNEVAYWQGNHSASGDNTFAVNSSINITPSSQNSVETVGNRYSIEQSGIVALLADRQAIAIGINKRRTASFNNDIDDYTNYKTAISQQMINDTSENGILFIVSDTAPVTPGITLDKSTLTFANSSADSKSLTATTMPADATVTWKTSKASIATVSDGTVSPAGAGSCKITAEITVGGTKYTAECDVTVGS